MHIQYMYIEVWPQTDKIDSVGCKILQILNADHITVPFEWMNESTWAKDCETLGGSERIPTVWNWRERKKKFTVRILNKINLPLI